MANIVGDMDKDLKGENSFSIEDLCWLDAKSEPFDIYGLYNAKEEPEFKRLPDEVAEATNGEVAVLAKNTAGGRVRFTTNSCYIAIKTSMPWIRHMNHMPMSSASGFDLYIDQEGKGIFKGIFMPPVDLKDGYESVIWFPNRISRSVTIHFPLYNPVSTLYIGIQKDAVVEHGAKYKYDKPILYYGSSITQGGCASRPGNCYENIISAKLDCDHMNLGFSGSAKAEDNIVDYMAALDFSIFVSDYDHNAPDVEYLKNTHEKMFLKIRETHPDTPVIFMSKPDFENGREQNILRRDVIYQTYMHALSRGDKNVYFIDGERLFKDSNRDACTVDGCHPNDAGFVRMAEVVGHTIEGILRKNG